MFGAPSGSCKDVGALCKPPDGVEKKSNDNQPQENRQARPVESQPGKNKGGYPAELEGTGDPLERSPLVGEMPFGRRQLDRLLDQLGGKLLTQLCFRVLRRHGVQGRLGRGWVG